jgi:hypothetical protein
MKKIAKAILAGNGLPNYSFSKILYSGKDYQGRFHLYVYDVAADKMDDLGLGGLVDKCV